MSTCPVEAGRIVQHLCRECSEERAGKIYKVLVECILDATSVGSPNGNHTSPQFRHFFQTLTGLIKLQDSLLMQRVKHCVPHLVARCPRLLERQNPGDDEFLYEMSKLLLWIGTRVPEGYEFLMR